MIDALSAGVAVAAVFVTYVYGLWWLVGKSRPRPRKRPEGES